MRKSQKVVDFLVCVFAQVHPVQLRDFLSSERGAHLQVSVKSAQCLSDNKQWYFGDFSLLDVVSFSALSVERRAKRKEQKRDRGKKGKRNSKKCPQWKTQANRHTIQERKKFGEKDRAKGGKREGILRQTSQPNRRSKENCRNSSLGTRRQMRFWNWGAWYESGWFSTENPSMKALFIPTKQTIWSEQKEKCSDMHRKYYRLEWGPFYMQWLHKETNQQSDFALNVIYWKVLGSWQMYPTRRSLVPIHLLHVKANLKPGGHRVRITNDQPCSLLFRIICDFSYSFCRSAGTRLYFIVKQLEKAEEVQIYCKW